MTRLHLKKSLAALAMGTTLLFGSLVISSSASGDSGTRTAAGSATLSTEGQVTTRKTKPVSVGVARNNARRAAQSFYDRKGPYINRGVPELETAWNERGTAECRKLGGGIRIRCAAWVGLAAELSDEEVPYKTCDWWVETVRLRSGQIIVRDLVAKRACETLWF